MAPPNQNRFPMKKHLFFAALLVITALLNGCSFQEDWQGFDVTSYGGGERYNSFEENPFIVTAEQPVSTFGLDADGAAYSNMRRFLSDGTLPPKDAVRTEELMNYFLYDYAEPIPDENIGINGEVSGCPWNTQNRLIRIGVKGKTIAMPDLPPSNFVLLLDISGSMDGENKLELLKEGLPYLVNTLRAQDRLAIVTYAGSSGVALASTPGNQKTVINNAIQNLQAGGSTAGADGINTAYEIAQQYFTEAGNNRVILATDGDFNVGITDPDELVALIKEKRQTGIYLSVWGVGTGNLNDAMMERLADNGNGIYEYIDNLAQARKVMEYEFNKFYPVAKDVKIQVTFNPEMVSSYRLIGYENRLINNTEFETDTTDTGDLSAGQTVTALYEIVPVICSACSGIPSFTINFRYKKPVTEENRELNLQITDAQTGFEQASENMRFAASVAAYGMLLRKSDYKGTASYEQVINWAQNARTFDPYLWRSEFADLVNIAKNLP